METPEGREAVHREVMRAYKDGTPALVLTVDGSGKHFLQDENTYHEISPDKIDEEVEAWDKAVGNDVR